MKGGHETVGRPDGAALAGREPAVEPRGLRSFLGALEGLAHLFEPAPRRLAEGRSSAPEGGDHFYTLEPQPHGWPPSEVTADGVRDRTHPVEKPELTSRVVFLGDSVTEGFGVAPEEI